MKKVHAPTLEEAYQKAAKELACSITEVRYEVIQHPSKGIFGLFKKEAIIVATFDQSAKPLKTDITTPQKQQPDELPLTDIEETSSTDHAMVIQTNSVVESFFDTDMFTEEKYVEETVIYDELALLIENQLKELLSHSCFDIDVLEVDVRDNTALIFIDGEDAALLIGKEGYRYNALSYMLFNWLHAKYELFVKLEIAEFLTSQQEMIRNYIKPVIENVNKFGKGKTRPLDGILVQIALEQLREAFPNKYVAVKTGRDGGRFVVINDFNTKHHAS
ncbi:MAG: Jag N-terminal domain-containing protein [Campylobacterales bacterium]|nr:Jag N-terminal domain-containing protein [Campylobacterales bacterium]